MLYIITDSTSDIDTQYALEKNIQVVPLNVIFKGVTYKDRIDLKPEQFYTLLETSDTLPTTSQPAPQEFLTLFEQVKKQGDSAIVLTLSSQLSGTYQSACIAKDLVEYENIHIIDSLNATQGLRILVEKAIQLRDTQTSIDDIITILEDYKQRIQIFAYVDTLEYLYKGGRLSKTSAAIGSMLKVKPIIGLKEGKLEVFGKARGTNKATTNIIQLINNHPIDLKEPICIGYTGEKQGLDKFENTLKEALGFNNVFHAFVGPVIGTHAGPGAKFIAYVKKDF